MKITLIGAGGARTPLLLHGLRQAMDQIRITEIALYDVNRSRAELMAALGREITGSAVTVSVPPSFEQAIEGARFVASSIRVGGIAARARDEEVIIEQGLTGQETTGPGGLAMALRTVPVALAQARLIERYAPDATLINFTNPAGLVTQALRDHTRLHVIGICDTPSELFHRIAETLGEQPGSVGCAYAGLNHLGWVSRVNVRGEDAMDRLLRDDDALLRLYPSRLFEPAMIRTMRLIPSEYLYFVYGRGLAFRDQVSASLRRGAQLLHMNQQLFDSLNGAVSAGRAEDALRIYKQYLNRRNATYMRSEPDAVVDRACDPFESATGYHRIAIDVMAALCGDAPKKIVVNVRNGSAIADLSPTDVVEVPCLVDRNGALPLSTGALPAPVRGLVLAVKEYERLAIRAAVEGSLALARLSLLVYPVVGEWEPAERVLNALAASDPEHLGYLR